LEVKKKVATQTVCHGDLIHDDLAPCLRGRKLEALMTVKLDSPRFLPGFAPFADDGLLLGAGVGGGIGDPMTPFSGSAAAKGGAGAAGAAAGTAARADELAEEAMLPYLGECLSARRFNSLR